MFYIQVYWFHAVGALAFGDGTIEPGTPAWLGKVK